jgi:hypothetical protein
MRGERLQPRIEPKQANSRRRIAMRFSEIDQQPRYPQTSASFEVRGPRLAAQQPNTLVDNAFHVEYDEIVPGHAQ